MLVIVYTLMYVCLFHCVALSFAVFQSHDYKSHDCHNFRLVLYKIDLTPPNLIGLSTSN